jgi:predicted Zn-dependent protease
LSREDSEALFHKIVGLTTGGGDTSVTIRLSYSDHLRWARNHPTTTGFVRNFRVIIQRIIGDVRLQSETSKIDDASLKEVIEKMEQRLQHRPTGNTEEDPVILPSAQKYATPALETSPLWSNTTFNVTDQMISDAAQAGVSPVKTAKMFAAGFAETRGETWAIFNTRGLAAYAVGTLGRYSETVRNPDGTGSGWAGLTHTDWTKLDVARLSARALQKCVASVNPVAIEPGRYTTILEPAATGAFMILAIKALNRKEAEQNAGPYAKRIGERVFDQRITISTDPADPDCPYIPFDGEGFPYRPVKWIENGVLKELAYDSVYARKKLGTDVPLPNPGAFRMTGGDTSIEEMIATTERGLLVTRFGVVYREDYDSLLISTVTQDGLWLIEKGKIKAPVKNMRVLESPIIACNTVLQLGKPERISGMASVGSSGFLGEDLDNKPSEAFGSVPVVVPPMKLQDFNFVSMSDAV